MPDPAGIKNLLAQLASQWGMQSPLEVARLFNSWEQIVGAEIAAKCRPTSLKDGLLKVRTESPAWASQFKYFGPEVAKQVNLQLGKPLVREVKIWLQPGPETRLKGQVGKNRFK